MSTPLSPSSQTAHTQPRRASRDRLRGLATRYFNPLAARFAGSRVFPIFALLRHRGRRSGRAFVTPVAARPYPGGFIIPLTFGTEADWFQNLQAADGGGIRWKGVEHTLIAPEVIKFEEGMTVYNPLERAIMPLIGVTSFARLRDSSATL
jgi:deazaflavin-dependent oxidoreductase (nitroreductase family)